MRDYRIVLVLSGGNALGSYQAGAYACLHDHGIAPDWIIGASAGAINGAIIAGNPPAARVKKLEEFWRPSASSIPAFEPLETMRRSASVGWTLSTGRPGLFAPSGPLGSWWIPDPTAATSSLFDTEPLRTALEQHVDFTLLNTEGPRYTATAVDLATGADVRFDTMAGTVTADHIRASAALMPTFPAIEIDGQWLVDGGMSANLPLDPVFEDSDERCTLCIAIDLMPLQGSRPHTIGEAASRAQDLMFAIQSRRTLERWAAVYAVEDASRAGIVMARIAYHDQAHEVAGKAMDYSPGTSRSRWDAGYRDAERLSATITDPAFTIPASAWTLI